jgi:hypothetical protein
MEALWNVVRDKAGPQFDEIRTRVNYQSIDGRDNIELLLSHCQVSQLLKSDRAVADFVVKSEELIVEKCRFVNDEVDLATHESFLRKVVKWIGESAGQDRAEKRAVVLELAYLPSAEDTTVSLTPERLFGRHCAVLGATGGGKSWTVARLIEQAARFNAKVLLFDATGEFHTAQNRVLHAHIGHDPAPPVFSKEIAVPYNELTEADLFALFKPSGQTQAPKLRSAMKSLKLAKLVPTLATNGS